MFGREKDRKGCKEDIESKAEREYVCLSKSGSRRKNWK